ncbi:alpha/beta hydrolase [Nocardia sp. NBC_01327]|uniref:alpha/beta hydrolase n=1 Tax=Nocardia sp. NBC_01327 TaxID=2903593 RepID=UPI002E105F62|nr:alpha/beta hydrolase [Nocardia sp. NBC_01327]
MPYFEGARGRLHYRRWSLDRPAATLVLLPGTGQHSGHYHRFARALAPAGIELWTLDTSGHGLSEGDPERPGSLPELAADALTFLALVPSPPPLFLMGHSLGAATALAAITADSTPPCAGLILCGTPKAVLAGQPPKSARGAAATEPRSVGAAARSGGSVGGTHPQPSTALGDASNPARGKSVSTAPGRGIEGGREPVLPEGIPVLCVHGVDDRRTPVGPVREWAGRVAAEFREYEDAGHDLLHEPVHAEVTADIAAWVGSVAGSS